MRGSRPRRQPSAARAPWAEGTRQASACEPFCQEKARRADFLPRCRPVRACEGIPVALRSTPESMNPAPAVFAPQLSTGGDHGPLKHRVQTTTGLPNLAGRWPRAVSSSGPNVHPPIVRVNQTVPVEAVSTCFAQRSPRHSIASCHSSGQACPIVPRHRRRPRWPFHLMTSPLVA